ncbi:putative trifunctional 2-polyprenylphenol hydroxylase/glutamate synthase subunit beta/ferritin domain-containing protein [bacterium BMS3Abin14]|nr:putative trifunctional 2-polyprenylphenol hydroxylase/glutamate synthase subunit beta/ferritin domain-containing protein [bacterium BMS3Abin14]
MDQKKAYGPHEAVTLGLELEIAGYNFYTRVAQAATDYRIRDLFQHLANSEKEHRRVIKEEIEPIFAPEWYREEDQEMMAQYLRKIEKQPVFPNPEKAEAIVRGADSAIKAIDIGILAEKQAVEYFLFLRDATRDGTGKQAFDRLRLEEVKHLKLLNDLKKDLLA